MKVVKATGTLLNEIAMLAQDIPVQGLDAKDDTAKARSSISPKKQNEFKGLDKHWQAIIAKIPNTSD